MSNRDNPQAFPRVGRGYDPMTGHTDEGDDGMTLRDYFAGQALNEANREIWAEHKYEHVAGRAYGIADAMLLERGK